MFLSWLKITSLNLRNSFYILDEIKSVNDDEAAEKQKFMLSVIAASPPPADDEGKKSRLIFYFSFQLFNFSVFS